MASCSSPSSASSKGMIRYLASGVVMRSYYSGVRAHLLQLIETFDSMTCCCEDPSVSVSIFGVSCKVCIQCAGVLKQSCLERSRESPHCVTLHATGDHMLVLSVCTGSVMRRTDENPPRWVDTMVQSPPASTYSSLTSELCSLIPFKDYISPVRAGLVSTYLQQAVCNPSCRYDPTRVREQISETQECPGQTPHHREQVQAVDF